jgi:diguanylate cyclase (GGDEF)-like protein
MIDLKRGEAKFVLGCVSSFAQEFERGVVSVLAGELRGVEPPEVRELREQLYLLQRQLESTRQQTVRVHDTMAGLLKRVLSNERRRVAEALERPLAKASSPGVVSALQREVMRYDQLLTRPPFDDARMQAIPQLTDFMSIRFAAEAMRDAPKLAPRVYDEKFHILEAPRLFLPDLAHYRHECGLRRAPLAVCYIDIDDFKAINERLTETVVDLKVLAPFLELLEAWVFGHGHAYRFGGDEFVILLPNVKREIALAMLEDLRGRVGRARFRAKDVKLSISQGVYLVDPECVFTDREILAGANSAKAFAKKACKGKIAIVEAPSWEPAMP